ncbi:TonB-dependent receptor [Horticoccus sp. 23ND18S-11]|uniref:TonB-dependent receptor n=1 Tax=Horticoccus sp. 23ND18S-11 TaxID=3391832 RepID=UPI0039C998F3
MPRALHALRRCFALVLVLLGLGAALVAFGQAAGTGTVEGRVQSAATGNFLNNARVRVAGTSREVFTNSFGEYRLLDLPAGPATLEVFFTGVTSQSVSVTVPAGGAVTRDVVVGAPAGSAVNKDGTLVMNQYVVQSQRETDATAIAINEQRFAANRKDVVSTDAFGEINQGNIGEFVKFLPGISLDVKDGNTPSGIMIRGFDPNYTNVTVDGGQIASTIIANTQTSSRQFVLDGANINNVARIEVTKLPTPDMSANLLGGAVNFVSRSAFERPRRELRVSAYLSANAKAMDFDQSPGPFVDSTYKVLPSFDLQFVDPVNKKFGYVVTAQHSSQFYLQNRTVLGARFTSAGATLANPYTTNVNTNFAHNRSDRTSGAVTMDFKPWARNVLQLKLQANASRQQSGSRSLNYNVGGNQPTRFDQNNVFGAATGGSAGLSTSFQSRHALTRAINGGWTFTGREWTIETAASWSHSNNRTRDTAKGFFNSVSVALPNVARVNLENIQHDEARFGAASVFNAAGGRIDELKLANYNLTQVGSMPLNAFDVIKEARVNITKQLTVLQTPLAVKFGGSVNDMTRDLDYTAVNWLYVGPDGIANSGDEGMANFVSTADRGVSPGFGRAAPEWPDTFRIFEAWKNNPRSFLYGPTQGGDTVRNAAIRSPWLHETITSGYVMADTKFFQNRLRLVGGVRYEGTEDEGRGFNQDADAVLVKDAQGNPIKTNGAFVVRPELLPVGSGAYNAVLYRYRGYYNARDYHYYHPSAHATFNLTNNLQLRAAFAKTIGRPNLSDIVPNLFVGENVNFGVPGNTSGNVPGFITGANIALKPWRAKNYDYSIEYYLPRNGLLMFNWYRKDIRDFFSTESAIADAALLAQLGVSNDALGYQYTRPINVADARITGWETRADLPLANFTEWVPSAMVGDVAKHFTLMANFTHLDLHGTRITSRDWRRYIPRSRNLGMRYSFAKISGNVLLNWRGRMLRDTANQFPGANEYIRARYQLDGNVEYQVTRRFSVFFAGRNLTNEPTQWEVSGPGVPRWSTLTNYEDYGAQYSLGVRGTF